MAKLWVYIDHMPDQILNHNATGDMHKSPLMKTCAFITCFLIYYVFPVWHLFITPYFILQIWNILPGCPPTIKLFVT